ALPGGRVGPGARARGRLGGGPPIGHGRLLPRPHDQPRRQGESRGARRAQARRQHLALRGRATPDRISRRLAGPRELGEPAADRGRVRAPGRRPRPEPGGPAPPRSESLVIGYLASEYPAISHTFIRREIEALRARGIEIRTFALHPPPRSAPLG